MTHIQHVIRCALVALVMLTFVVPVASAAPDHAPEEAILRVLEDFARAERDGDTHAQYDALASGSRDQMSRQAYREWKGSQPAMFGEGDIVIDSVSDTNWRDPHTRQKLQVYEVSLSSPRDMTIRMTMEMPYKIILETDETLAEISAANQNFTVTFESRFSTPIYKHLDTFWAQAFSDAGVPYESPVDIKGVSAKSIETGCGEVEDMRRAAAMYCTVDHTIYFDTYFRDDVVEYVGEEAWVAVISHEWSHHVQRLLGIEVQADPELFGGVYTIENELQADCLAGIVAQDYSVRDLVDDDEYRDQAYTLMTAVGDPRGTSWSDAGAHGTAKERQTWWQTGFDSGFRGCSLRIVEPESTR